MALDVAQFGEAHLQNLAALTGEPLVTEEDEAQARASLAVAWENVKEAGSSSWTLASAPSLALSILVQAAARAWMNLGGFTDERADAVTLARAPEFAAGAELTDEERGKLGRLTGRDLTVGTLKSVPVSALTSHDRRYGDEYAPFWERNIMVMPFTSAGRPWTAQTRHPIPYLPGDEVVAAQAGDITSFVPGYVPAPVPVDGRRYFRRA